MWDSEVKGLCKEEALSKCEELCSVSQSETQDRCDENETAMIRLGRRAL
jgi:hypothetical protein